MKTKEVLYEQDGEVLYKVVVQEATALMGIRRTRMRLSGSDEQDQDMRLLAMYSYADCVAASIDAEGLDLSLSLQDFAILPGRFVALWEEAVYDLNGHWLPQPPAKEDDKEDGDPKQLSSTDA